MGVAGRAVIFNAPVRGLRGRCTVTTRVVTPQPAAMEEVEEIKSEVMGAEAASMMVGRCVG